MTSTFFKSLHYSQPQTPVKRLPKTPKNYCHSERFSGEEPAVRSTRTEKAGSSDLKVFGMTSTFFKSLHCSQPQSPVKRLPKTPKNYCHSELLSGEEPAFVSARTEKAG